MASRRRLLGHIPRCTGILANLAFSMHFGFRPHINSFLDDSKLSFWKNSFKSEDFRKKTNMFLHLHADNIKGVLAKVTGVHLYLHNTSDCVPYNCLLHYISSRLGLYCHLLLWRCFLDELWGGEWPFLWSVTLAEAFGLGLWSLSMVSYHSLFNKIWLSFWTEALPTYVVAVLSQCHSYNGFMVLCLSPECLYL